MNKKILITGGSGFVGYNLLKNLYKDNKIYYTNSLNENKIKEKNTYLLCQDYRNINFSFKELKNIDVLYHLAAITDTLNNNDQEMLEINTYGSLKLFKNAIKNGCKKIVYASSCSVYGNSKPPYKEQSEKNPLNIYAKSKHLLDESIIKENFSIPVIGLRYSNIYGSGESHKKHSKSMISQIIEKINSNQEIELFEFGEQKRDFVYIKDITKINILASNYNKTDIFNAGSGYCTSFNEVVSIIENILNKKAKIKYIKNKIKDYFQSHTECDMNYAKNNLLFNTKWKIKEGIFDYITNI